MTAPANISKLERVRNRDGDNCWLCGKPIDFTAAPNSTRAPTFEHLLALSHGGPDRVENLVLCHPGCNRTLADRPIVKKVELRERRRRKEWLAVMQGQLRKILGL